MSTLAPSTPDELHAWILEHTKLRVPRKSVCAHHQAPFEYLLTSFFEPSRDQIIWAPRGGGKTSLAAVATLLDLLFKPGVTIRILGGSLEQSLRMWDYLVPLIETYDQQLIENSRGTARRIKLTTGSQAAVLTQSQRSVRGQRVQKLRCDEVEHFDPRVWEAAQLVTRSKDVDGNTVRGTIEAMSTLHQPFGLMQQIVDKAQSQQHDPTSSKLIRWCVLDVLERCPPTRDCASCALWDECKGVAKTHADGFFPIDDAITMKARVSAETWANEMLCLRPSLRDRVFASFDRDVHVRETPHFTPDRDSQWWLGIDFGYANPFVCLWIIQRGDDVHVIDEYVQRQRTVAHHLTEIEKRPWPRAPRVACDPAGNARNEQTARSDVDLLRARGYAVKTRSSPIVDGVELVRAALRSATGHVRLSLHPRCTTLITALQSYHYPPTGGELPLKDGVHDHPVDALRYFYVNVARGARVVTRSY